MNILFVDHDNIQTETRVVLLHEIRHHDVEIAEEFKAAKKLYKKDKYDIVIIDYIWESARKTMEHIRRIDPDQKMIILNKYVEVCIPEGCEYCLANHQMRLLADPFPMQTFFAYIDDFKFHPCQHANQIPELKS